jgi:hypothetical protein
MPHENPFTTIHLSPNTKKRMEKLGEGSMFDYWMTPYN